MTAQPPTDEQRRALARAAEGAELSPVEQLHVDMWQADARAPYSAEREKAQDEARYWAGRQLEAEAEAG